MCSCVEVLLEAELAPWPMTVYTVVYTPSAIDLVVQHNEQDEIPKIIMSKLLKQRKGFC